MSKTEQNPSGYGSTVGDDFSGGVGFLEEVLRASEVSLEEQLGLDEEQRQLLLEIIKGTPVTELDHVQSLTDLKELKGVLARIPESVLSCLYDVIDNALSSQLTLAYLTEEESGESATVDIHLELDQTRDIIWFRVQDWGHAIADGEMKSAVFGAGKSSGEGLLNHFGVGLLVALCYVERSIELHAATQPKWTIMSMTEEEDRPRKITGPVTTVNETDIERATQSEWDDWEGQKKPGESGTRIEIPIPFEHFATDLESGGKVTLDDVGEEVPDNKYLHSYAQRLRRRLGRDYALLLSPNCFVADDSPVKMLFGWDDEFYKAENGKAGKFKGQTSCRVPPLEMVSDEPGDHIDYDWPEIRVNESISWSVGGEPQEALVRLKLMFLDEAATYEQYDIEREDVDDRLLGGTKILNSKGTLGDVYRPSKSEQGIVLTMLGRAVDPSNMQVLDKNRSDPHNRVFGRLDVVPMPGSKVPSVMKAHKQGVEMGGSPAWEAMQELFEELPLADLSRGNWNAQDGDDEETTNELSTQKTTQHDLRQAQTWRRFSGYPGTWHEEEFRTSGFKTDNLCKWPDGTIELVEQKDDKETVAPRTVWHKVGELTELADEGHDVDIVKIRCKDITRDNKSAVLRAVVSLAILHEVEVKIVRANDDTEMDTDDIEIISYDPSTADLPESVEDDFSVLSQLLDFIRKEAGDIDVTEFDE